MLPRRRFVLEAKIGADDIIELERALDEIAQRVHAGLPCVCTTGGPVAGWHVEVSEDPTITHDSYFEAIQKLREEERAAPPEKPEAGP